MIRTIMRNPDPSIDKSAACWNDRLGDALGRGKVWGKNIRCHALPIDRRRGDASYLRGLEQKMTRSML